jgi:hypothetical protein
MLFLSFWVFVGILSCTLLLLEVVHGIRSYARLSSFPGPPVAAWSKLWMLKCLFKKNLHLELKAVCEKYGKGSCTFMTSLRFSLSTDPTTSQALSSALDPTTWSRAILSYLSV